MPACESILAKFNKKIQVFSYTLDDLHNLEKSKKSESIKIKIIIKDILKNEI